MAFSEFPKVKYGPGGEVRTVESPEAEAALGDGWGDTKSGEKDGPYVEPVANPAAAPEFQEYPKMVGKRLVYSVEEEAALGDIEQRVSPPNPDADDTQEIVPKKKKGK